MTNYESVRQLVESLPPGASASSRDVKWLTGSQVIGVARDPDGQVEVFLAGPELNPISTSVADAVEFHTWHRADASPLQANRILLPALGHFDQVAAFICTELVRNGAEDRLVQAFAKTEPIIELAIERLRLSNLAIAGLAGELLLLDALCRRGVDSAVGSIVDSWAGWRRSSRDFSLGATGVEVKTTLARTSSHFIEGIHQVELSDGSAGGPPENRLYLISVGLQPAEAGRSTASIPQLVDRIVDRMKSTGNGFAVAKLLARIAEYGAAFGNGYEHGSQAADPAYATSFVTTFFRGFDMAGEAVQVLRRQDVLARPHVDLNFVKFRIDLPVVVGHDNPVNGPNQVALAILGASATSDRR